jgi:hypothetical protein
VIMAAAGENNVRVRGREGEEVSWSRKAARGSGMIKDQMDDALAEDGVYLAPMVETETLRQMGTLLEVEGEAAAEAVLANEDVAGVLHFIRRATYLDAAPALESAKRVLRRRLNGKRAEELSR